ncbi:DUF4391 domain-containing protein [Bifidobacterium simiiventris]|uniref:DUF4391 domain-containing protein n=1 Tax=Bifidobacterium simiiventris TaxID=2834434 RepID=UPI001C567FD2|nr:DUF4391 domain-containing protein [Bifidobacterium simiiventris]MBW3078117.1 DUF4391 domain-containing protein [Bifidobacterium simiiventris]
MTDEQQAPHAIAHCGSVSALTLGLPATTAIPEAKSRLPKAMFVGRAQISAKLRQRLTSDIESITMLALLRASNTALASGTRVPEILVIGLRLAPKATTVPSEVIDLIAAQRKSGIVFAVVREATHAGESREECAIAVRRALPGRAGHLPVHEVFADEWRPAGEARLDTDAVAKSGTDASVDDLWSSLCAQVILGTTDGTDLDARIVRRAQIGQLEMTIDKLARDHQRAKDADQRNEIFAKLHKARQQLEELRAQ